MEIILVMSGICALASGFIAVERNQNPVGWTLLGLALGVIGLILTAALCKDTDSKEQGERT